MNYIDLNFRVCLILGVDYVNYHLDIKFLIRDVNLIFDTVILDFRADKIITRGFLMNEKYNSCVLEGEGEELYFSLVNLVEKYDEYRKREEKKWKIEEVLLMA